MWIYTRRKHVSFHKRYFLYCILDIFVLWQMNTRNFVSLDAVARCLGLETHKDTMDGSMVGSTFHMHKDLNKIVNYCEMDVILTGKVMKRLCLDA